MAQYNIEISNKEDVELAMLDLYSICKGRGYEQKFLPKEEYDFLLNDKKSFESLYEKLKEDYEKLEKDSFEKLEVLESLQKQLQLLESENNQLKQETDELKKQSAVMNKELANYSVAYGVDDSNDVMYFMVESDSLKQTTRRNAPYIANRVGDKYKFKFNDNRPELDACEKRSFLLDPFCDIISFTEGANCIKHEAMGYFEKTGSVVKVIQKCQIRLIKK